MAAVLSATAHLHEEASEEEGTPPVLSHWRWWMSAAAAAVILAILAFPLWRGPRDRIGGLAALAPASERTVEPRLSGGFAWAPYRGPMRSTTTAGDTARLRLGGAAGEAIERADHDSSAETQHTAGVALMLIEKSDEAAARLEGAARTSRDAKTWSDLAAARYAAAVQSRRISLLPLALAADGEALRADPTLPEALFNRALILERMGSTGEARRAWLRYLEIDAKSPWAAEAREHLKELPAR
jgi:tetratricopeptide (TPR) repeat protein